VFAQKIMTQLFVLRAEEKKEEKYQKLIQVKTIMFHYSKSIVHHDFRKWLDSLRA